MLSLTRPQLSVIVAMVVMAPVVVYPQCASDTPDDATGHAAHNPTNRSKYAMADVAARMRSFPSTLSDALSLGRERHGKERYHTGSHYNTHIPIHGLISHFKQVYQ